MEKTVALSPYSDEKGRLYYYDNAKFILIFLVVLAHGLSPFKTPSLDHTDGVIFSYLWRVINTLHMPCLIFISGFFAKRYIGANGKINVQRPFTYVVYYIFAQITVALFEKFVLGDYINFSFFSPRSSLWFLVCLIWWYCFLPLVDKVNPKVMLPVAIVLGLAFGYDPRLNDTMSISRVVTHFPFFLCGYYFTPELFEKIYSKKGRIISIFTGAISLGLAVVLNVIFRPYGAYSIPINNIITCNTPYATIFKGLDIHPALWFLPRLAFYLMAVLLCFTFLAWVPRKKHYYTRFGARTLAVYILHRYLYLAYLEFKWYDYFNEVPYLRWAIFPVAFIITIVFSTYPFWLPFKLLGKIKITKLLKKQQ